MAIAATRLYKHDLAEGSREAHDFGEGRYPGEFVFVPRSEDAPEGDGWLIGLVVDLPNETTDLVIIDATRFSEAPVASIRIPHRVPPGFPQKHMVGFILLEHVENHFGGPLQLA